MQRIDLEAALAVILVPDPDGEAEERREPGFELGLAIGLAVDVTDEAAEPGAQELQFAAGALELMRVGVASDHDRSPFGDPQIALPQRHA